MESNRRNIHSPKGQIRQGRVVSVKAECLTCGKSWDSKNSMMTARNHNKHTGHKVVATQVIEVCWGDNSPDKPKYGLFDD